MLKGKIYITDNIDVIYNAPLNDGSTKIVDLDEEGVLDNFKTSSVIKGTCLLPPLDAKIAEVDGDEQKYDHIYSNHLLAPYQQQYVAALISYLYKGGTLIMFLPEVGYTNTQDKIIQHMFALYYIHIGKIGHQDPRIANCYYNNIGIPVWMNMIYMAGVISSQEYLLKYPVDARLDTNMEVLYKLVKDIRPCGDTFNECVEIIKRYHKLLHKNNKLVMPIFSTEEF